MTALHNQRTQDHSDEQLLAAVESLSADFGKDSTQAGSRGRTLDRDLLELVCYEYVSS